MEGVKPIALVEIKLYDSKKPDKELQEFRETAKRQLGDSYEVLVVFSTEFTRIVNVKILK